MPHFQKLFDKHKDNGVHFFAVEISGLTPAEIQAFAGENGWTLPFVALSESKLSGYDMATMPNMYVINGHGRVVQQGTDYEKFLDAALKDVKYPGLGKMSVAKECERAAQFFAKRDYTKAREAAQALLDAEPSEAVAADARHIIDRCAHWASTWRTEADAAKAAKRYTHCLMLLDRLAAHFKGADEGNTAAEEAKALRNEKEVKDSQRARKELEKVLAGNKRAKSKGDKVTALAKFYEKFEGTAAADEAKAMGEAIQSSKLYR